MQRSLLMASSFTNVRNKGGGTYKDTRAAKHLQIAQRPTLTLVEY